MFTEINRICHNRYVIQVLLQEKELNGNVDSSSLFQKNSKLNALNFKRIKRSLSEQNKKKLLSVAHSPLLIALSINCINF